MSHLKKVFKGLILVLSVLFTLGLFYTLYGGYSPHLLHSGPGILHDTRIPTDRWTYINRDRQITDVTEFCSVIRNMKLWWTLSWTSWATSTTVNGQGFSVYIFENRLVVNEKHQFEATINPQQYQVIFAILDASLEQPTPTATSPAIRAD